VLRKHFEFRFTVIIACSKRSDSGERCEVKKAMKSRGGLGREGRELSLTSPPPSLLFFRAPFYFAPFPLSERLERATVITIESSEKHSEHISGLPYPKLLCAQGTQMMY